MLRRLHLLLAALAMLVAPLAMQSGMAMAAKYKGETDRKCVAIIGDGAMTAGMAFEAMNHAGVAGALSFVSTAGGAFLEWMEGKPLPGVDALKI